MTETIAIEIGAEVRASDGPCGEVSRVVVDPIDQAVTHLVVGAKHHRESGRLVPLALVVSVTSGVVLSATKADFEKLDRAEETEFLPAPEGYSNYRPDQVLAWPYYGLGSNMRLGGDVNMDLGRGRVRAPVVYDTVPLGEVDIHRGEAVRATDGTIGHVQGLVIDPRNHHVTHVLLQEGHFWGRKQVAIPIKAVTRVDGMVVKLTRQEVEDLPDVEVDDPIG